MDLSFLSFTSHVSQLVNFLIRSDIRRAGEHSEKNSQKLRLNVAFVTRVYIVTSLLAAKVLLTILLIVDQILNQQQICQRYTNTQHEDLRYDCIIAFGNPDQCTGHSANNIIIHRIKGHLICKIHHRQ